MPLKELPAYRGNLVSRRFVVTACYRVGTVSVFTSCTGGACLADNSSGHWLLVLLFSCYLGVGLVAGGLSLEMGIARTFIEKERFGGHMLLSALLFCAAGAAVDKIFAEHAGQMLKPDVLGVWFVSFVNRVIDLLAVGGVAGLVVGRALADPLEAKREIHRVRITGIRIKRVWPWWQHTIAVVGSSAVPPSIQWRSLRRLPLQPRMHLNLTVSKWGEEEPRIVNIVTSDAPKS